MSDPSDKAVEAAAEAMYEWASHATVEDGTGLEWFQAEARAALSAALPIIRAELADEIEADEIPAHWTLDARQGFHVARTRAARLVRGEATT